MVLVAAVVTAGAAVVVVVAQAGSTVAGSCHCGTAVAAVAVVSTARFHGQTFKRSHQPI